VQTYIIIGITKGSRGAYPLVEVLAPSGKIKFLAGKKKLSWVQCIK